MKILLTGASGLLGRAVHKKFEAEDIEVYGTAFSRSRPGLHRIDLTDGQEVHAVVQQVRPAAIVHAAAARFPDKVDADPEGAAALNVAATRKLCLAAEAVGAPVLYISTDYVFDGKNAPYSVNDKPSPVNLYGRTKAEGEQATLAVSQGNVVLRVPLLYGPVEHLSESAVTVLLESLLDSTKHHRLSDYEKRYPSHVDDIAAICCSLLQAKLQGKPVDGIFHWSGQEMLTKYQMVVQMAQVFGLQHGHIEADPSPPASSSAARPYDTRLDTSRLQQLGLAPSHTPFQQGIQSVLRPWVHIQ